MSIKLLPDLVERAPTTLKEEGRSNVLKRGYVELYNLIYSGNTIGYGCCQTKKKSLLKTLLHT